MTHFCYIYHLLMTMIGICVNVGIIDNKEENKIIVNKIVSKVFQDAEKEIVRKRLEELEEFHLASISGTKHHRGGYGRPSPDVSMLLDEALVIEEATKKLKRHMGIASIKKIKVKRSVETSEESCNLETHCDPSYLYRTFSGRCNNIIDIQSGSANSLLGRILPAEYDDNISSPRIKGKWGKLLPNPRSVSQIVHSTESSPDPDFCLSLMQWGQIVDHDITHVPVVRGPDNTQLNCKDCNSNLKNQACLPILLPSTETFHEKTDSIACMPLVRSMSGQSSLGPREHPNQITHYLDGSMVYGSSACQIAELREGEDSPMLKTSTSPQVVVSHPSKPLLPLTTDDPDCLAEDGHCFMAGDARVNEQPGLTSFQIILMREHNRLAASLASINLHWKSEKLFQEARRILVATIQHITFSEFLPRVLGQSTVDRFSLSPVKTGYFKDYNSTCSVNIYQEFATAAFRFGHSMIGNNVLLKSEIDMEEGNEGRQMPLRGTFHNPDMIKFNQTLDDLLRGLVVSTGESMDNKMSEEVVNHLFEKKGEKFSGMDLVALNIQRGREHGIPGYNKYRQVCGLVRAVKFKDFLTEIPREIVDRMSLLYSHPDDVDIFTGLISETRLSDGIVGPTLACLLGIQFQRLRSCDRFWYETGSLGIRFSLDQLTVIRRQSLGGLLCRNFDTVGKINPKALNQVRGDNRVVPCEEMDSLDLQSWSEENINFGDNEIPTNF